MTLAEFNAVLQVAVSPVILISGVGLLLLSMTNRLGRVIDRARSIADRRRREDASDHQQRLEAQLPILWRRARLLRMAISAAAVGVLLAAILIVLLFLVELFQWPVATPLLAGLFCSALLTVIVSVVYFLRDLNLSLRALALEIGIIDHS